MVLALLTLTVILLTMLLVFNVTQLTTEKERMQNTADSIAYSVAVVEGRDLNFAAYTNRAMAANQVAVAQFVGLISWTRYLYEMSYNLWIISQGIKALGALIPPLFPIGNAMDRFFNAIRKNILNPVLVNMEQKILNRMIKALQIVNKILSISQSVFHYASVETAISTWRNTMKDSDPDAEFTAMGLAGLGLHEYNWLTKFAVWDVKSPGIFRFADVTMEMRDKFTKYRGYYFPFFNVEKWPLSLGPIEVYFQVKMGWGKRGGTDLIMHKPKAGGKKPDPKDKCPEPNLQEVPVCGGPPECSRLKAARKACGRYEGDMLLRLIEACYAAPTNKYIKSNNWLMGNTDYFNGSQNVANGKTAVVCTPPPLYCTSTVDLKLIDQCRALETEHEKCLSQCSYERGWDYEYACREYPNPNPPDKYCYFDTNWGSCANVKPPPVQNACYAFDACYNECQTQWGPHAAAECLVYGPFPTTCQLPAGITCPAPAPGPAPVAPSKPTCGPSNTTNAACKVEWNKYTADYNYWRNVKMPAWRAALNRWNTCNTYNSCLSKCYSERGPGTTSTDCKSLPYPPLNKTPKTLLKCQPPSECRPLILPPEAKDGSDEGNKLASKLKAECITKEAAYDNCLNSCYSERSFNSKYPDAWQITYCRDKVSPEYQQCLEEARDKYVKCMAVKKEAEDHNKTETDNYNKCLLDPGNFGDVPADKWSWVGVDTAGLEFVFGFGLKLDLGFFGKITIIPPTRVSVDIPLAYAAARAGPFDPKFPLSSMDTGTYGNANKPGGLNVGYNLAKYLWGNDGFIPTPYPVFPLDIAKKRIFNPIRTGQPPAAKGPVYEGLQKYMHMKDLTNTSDYSPALFVEIYKPVNKAISKGNMKVGGRFDISRDQPESIYAAAKAELVFDRSLFPRSDGGVEYANMFNPYWQARLSAFGGDNKPLMMDESKILWYYRVYISK